MEIPQNTDPFDAEWIVDVARGDAKEEDLARYWVFSRS